jgi:hypothetical protein
VIFLLNASWPKLDTQRSLRDAAADDADIRRYAKTCSRTRQMKRNRKARTQIGRHEL